MRRRLKFKPPDEILTRIKDILYNALWENKEVWEDFYNRYGWKLKRIKRASYPCDSETLNLGALYDLKGFIFVPPQTEKYQNIRYIYVKTRYEPFYEYWAISFSVTKGKAKATQTARLDKKGRATELGKVMARISLWYRHYIRYKPPEGEWIKLSIDYFNWYLHKFKTKTTLSFWHWIIKKTYNYYLYSSFKRALMPEGNWRAPRYPVMTIEPDFESPELYIVLQDEPTARESLYKIRAVHCRCPYYEKNPRKARVITSHDGQNGLKIPVLQAILARYRKIRTGGILLFVEKVWRRSGAYCISPLWIEDEIIKKLARVELKFEYVKTN